MSDREKHQPTDEATTRDSSGNQESKNEDSLEYNAEALPDPAEMMPLLPPRKNDAEKNSPADESDNTLISADIQNAEEEFKAPAADMDTADDTAATLISADIPNAQEDFGAPPNDDADDSANTLISADIPGNQEEFGSPANNADDSANTLISADIVGAADDFGSPNTGSDDTANTLISADVQGMDGEFRLPDKTKAPGVVQTLASGAGNLNRAAQDSNHPDKLGRFRLERLLGRGAFGAVYLAHDPRLDRKVAIKVARVGVFDSDHDQERFFREARAAAGLRHPSIVPVYEVGRIDATNFIVTDFIKGCTLGDVMKEAGQLPAKEAVRYFKSLCDAMKYAHEQGVIHRDLKPDNVLIDEDGNPHIADFGLARREEDITRTQEGAIMGTPAYMSPEQATGKANQADGRTDIWSLGIIFNEMLTGKRAFTGTVTKVLLDVKQREVTPLRQIDASIPADLETICMKCLEKQPDQRFNHAGLIVDELGRWERGEPILSRPISVFARVGRFAKRNPLVAGLIAAVIVTLSFGILFSSLFAWEANTQRRNALAAQKKRALEQVRALSTATASSVPEIIENIRPNSEDVVAPLWDELEQAENNLQAARYRTALLSLDPAQAEEQGLAEQLRDDLLSARSGEFLVLRDALVPFGDRFLPELQAIATDPAEQDDRRFRAAAALAGLSDDTEHWKDIAAETTSQLLIQDTLDLPDWIRVFEPVRSQLQSHLAKATREPDTLIRVAAADVFAELFRDEPEQILPLLKNADNIQLATFIKALAETSDRSAPLLKAALKMEGLTRHRTNLGLALAELGAKDVVHELLAAAKDESVRSAMIDRAGPTRIDPQFFVDSLDANNPRVVAASILALGEFPSDRLSAERRSNLVPRLATMLTTHKNSEVHSAAQWLLKKWSPETYEATAKRIPVTKPTPDREWTVNSQGQTMVLVRARANTVLGSPPEEVSRAIFADLDLEDPEEQRTWNIPRDFVMSAREVTVGEFRRFCEATGARFRIDKRFARTDNCPMNKVSWYQAAAYCAWLTKEEKIDESQWCYSPGKELPNDLLDRSGYRLPTAAEWEFACRAGTVTIRSFGTDPTLLDKYMWHVDNARDQLHDVGSLKPNGLGLFDMHGNAEEWCHNFWFEDTYDADLEKPLAVLVDGDDKRRTIEREVRGGSIEDKARNIRSAARVNLDDQGESFQDPNLTGVSLGFRIVRTVPGK